MCCSWRDVNEKQKGVSCALQLLWFCVLFALIRQLIYSLILMLLLFSLIEMWLTVLTACSYNSRMICTVTLQLTALPAFVCMHMWHVEYWTGAHQEIRLPWKPVCNSDPAWECGHGHTSCYLKQLSQQFTRVWVCVSDSPGAGEDGGASLIGRRCGGFWAQFLRRFENERSFPYSHSWAMAGGRSPLIRGC